MEFNPLTFILPYLKDFYSIKGNVKSIYFNVDGDNDLLALEYIYEDTDLFTKMEYMYKNELGYKINDSIISSILVITGKDKELSLFSEHFLNGNFSKIRECITICKCYSSSFKDLEEMKDDINLQIIFQKKKLRDLLSSKIGVNLSSDSELGNIPEKELYLIKTV